MAYALPSPADLKIRYPAFAAIDDATVQYWLTDAQRYADTTWIESDYAPALIAAAAHFIVRSGAPGIIGADTGQLAAAGVTDFQSQGFRARISDEAVKLAIAGGFESTNYGQEYLALLDRNKAGGGITTSGTVCGLNAGYNGFAGPLGYPARLFDC